MFSHCIQYNTTAAAANAILTALDGNLCQLLHSLFKTEKLVEKLSDLHTKVIHMCKNSCCMFDGPFAERDCCPFCKHTQRNGKGMLYKIFRPIPLVPHLQALYANPKMAQARRYCANYHEPDTQEENAENTNQESNNTHSPSPPLPNDALPSSPLHPNDPLSSQLMDIFDCQHIAISAKSRSKLHQLKMKRFSKLWSTTTLKTSKMLHWGSHSMDSPSTKCLENQHRKLNTMHGLLFLSTTTFI